MFIRRDLQKETRELNECFLRWNFYFTKDQNRFSQKQFAIREFVNYESYFALCDLLVTNMRIYKHLYNRIIRPLALLIIGNF